MSDLNHIHAALNRLYSEEGQRIVFWNDPEREFFMAVSLLELDGVTTLRLDEVGALEAKVRLERDEPFGKFLLYSPSEEPDYEDDWLLDIRLYSRSFRADKASILLQELGLVNLTLRTHVADRRKFFDAKERLQKIKSLVEPNDGAADLDRKMIAVVAKADQPELFNLVRTIFHARSSKSAMSLLSGSFNAPAVMSALYRTSATAIIFAFGRFHSPLRPTELERPNPLPRTGLSGHWRSLDAFF